MLMRALENHVSIKELMPRMCLLVAQSPNNRYYYALKLW